MTEPFSLAIGNALLAGAANVSRGELLRFARRVVGSRASLAFEKESSTTMIAEQIAERLDGSSRLDDKVFDELLRMNPKAGAEIEHAREMWRERVEDSRHPLQNDGTSKADNKGRSMRKGIGSSAEDRTHDPTSKKRSEPPTNSEEEEWNRRVAAALKKARGSQPEVPAALLGALALLGCFDPVDLEMEAISKRAKSDLSPYELLQAISQVCDQLHDGMWSLRLPQRRSAIIQMYREETQAERLELAKLIDTNGGNAQYIGLVEEIFVSGAPDIGFNTSYEDLLVAQEVADWFSDLQFSPINTDFVAVLLENLRRIEPLRELVGIHFRGRSEELAILRRGDAFGEKGERVLVLSGNGGTGKSALLGKRILELLDSETRTPVVYIDFDRSEADPTDVRGLVALIARSLSLQFAETESANAFTKLESTAAGDVAYADEDFGLEQSASLEDILMGIAARLADLQIEQSPLFVFDTYEQLMLRGRSAADTFQQFLHTLLETIPSALVILAGRGHIPAVKDSVEIRLHELDEESADAVLDSRGVDDQKLRHRIFEAIGGSPLLLRIASTAVNSGKLSLKDIETFGAQAESLRRHGMLYSRILGHVGDKDVERLAHPGLVVRRVTPDIIRMVLADLCEIDISKADEIFERLPRFVDLFEPEDPLPGEEGLPGISGLQHRQDLRESVIETMTEDDKWRDTIPLIHQRAADFYRDRTDVRRRAEWLYHSLMLDKEPEVLDGIWDPDQADALVQSLGRTWSDPLPERARRWLAPRLGHDVAGPSEELRLADWEIATVRDAQDFIQMGNAEAALNLIRERPDRTALSPVPAVEIKALLILGKSKQALDVADNALKQAKPVAKPAQLMKLYIQVAEKAIAAGKTKRAVEAAKDAEQIAEALGDQKARLQALELASRGDADDAKSELARAFLTSPPGVLRSDAKTAGMVLKTLGEENPEVMGKAATVFANVIGADNNLRYLSEDPTELRQLFESVAQQEGGTKVLAGLAARAGLSSDVTDPSEIAFSTIRHRLHGEAISNSLRAFGDKADIRSQSFDMLKGLTR
ncbi:hypothetical protein [Hyphomonas sp.]|uniref:hypothetical protein n=1 Tax=Hyphomonas sp. TaxID=87 RepID=UPI003298D247